MHCEDAGNSIQTEGSVTFACRMYPSHNPASIGIILSGSPYSVYDAGSPHIDPDVFDLGIPILGICYGLQVCPVLSDLPFVSMSNKFTLRSFPGISEERFQSAIIENMDRQILS